MCLSAYKFNQMMEFVFNACKCYCKMHKYMVISSCSTHILYERLFMYEGGI